ncbi:hypothetical protein SAMN05877809_105165 [Rhodobacter sp. JA431]|uniref:hypothetical protein n=1 Tax=Rhodobacter sp. JA431 TaxID=570013 RepID=UPI000BCC5BA7|nr:hypothetical protein [Rhodobacter sp. JA431]SOC10729.1 hypothetical protein SAMN05877809_105165 [Rhodobacter sp. JA431]
MIKFFRKFRQREEGSVAIEGLFGGLLVLGWFVIAFQFYEAFRMRSQALRASYTIADMVSRERDSIGPNYVSGLKQIFDFISFAPNENYTWLRLSIITCGATTSDLRACDGTNKQFTLEKSYTAASGVAIHTQSSINAEADRIPMMAAGDTAVVLETSYTFFPIFSIGDKALKLDGQNWTRQGLSSRIRMSNFVVTRPRGPRTVWNDTK